MLIDDLYRSSSFRSHSAEYEEWMETVQRKLPRPRALTLADLPRIPFSHPRRVSFWEELEDLRQREAEGGHPQ